MATKNSTDPEKENVSSAEQSEVVLTPENHLAHLADQEEHEVNLFKAFALYPWVSVWCTYAAWTIILLSFDVQAAGAVVGIPQFRKDFGYKFGDDYVLPAAWQSGFNGAPIAS